MTLPNAFPVQSPDRRVDLDWLRICAFGLLIFYHVGMFYVTWDFHVKSSRASDAAEPLMLLLNPWRLLLLFTISGVATRFMMDKMSPGAFLGSRSSRLLIPLVFGMFVIVPPQTYFQVVQSLGFSGGWGEFYARYATASGHWVIDGEPLITPTWNHLWFVAYLFIFTLAILAVGPLVRRLPARWMAPLAVGPAVFILPWLVLTLMRTTLFPAFGESHAVVDDWYVLAENFAGFLFGYAVAKHEPFFAACERHRFIALGLALGAWAALMAVRASGADFSEADPALVAVRAAGELQAWCAILAAFGFARRHLRRDGPVRRYLTDAIFPFYIIHQTTIVVAGVHLDALRLPLWVEVPVLIGLTAASCVLTYEVARRVPPLRPFFGLKLKAAQAPARPPAPQPA